MCRTVPKQASMPFQVADLIGADPKEIIFTSGATESNNLAIKGISNFYRDRKKHIITTQTERECLNHDCRRTAVFRYACRLDTR